MLGPAAYHVGVARSSVYGPLEEEVAECPV